MFKRWNEYWYKHHKSSVEAALFFGWGLQDHVENAVRIAKRLGIEPSFNKITVTDDGIEYSTYVPTEDK